jgi:hypothetical protein
MTQSANEWWTGLSKQQQTIFIIVVVLLIVALLFSFNGNGGGRSYRATCPSAREVPPYVTSF